MHSHTHDNFSETLAAAKRGDQDAWRTLYERHSSPVLGYLRSQRAPGAEDLLGEVWLQAVRDLGRFEGDRRSFQSWLITIAHHRLLDTRRSLSRRPREVSGEITPESIAERTEASPSQQLEAEEELLELLGDLPERQRTLLYLRYVLDMSQKEVARVLGISTPALKMLQSRSLRALERCIRERDLAAASQPPLPLDTDRRLES